MKDIKCPYDLNQFLLGEPLFTNTFSDNECEQRKFYGDCFHCFGTSISKRDEQKLKEAIKDIKKEVKGAAKVIKAGYGNYETIIEIIDKHTKEEQPMDPMDNFNKFRTQRGTWIKRQVTDEKTVYQCSECKNVDNVKKKTEGLL